MWTKLREFMDQLDPELKKLFVRLLLMILGISSIDVATDPNAEAQAKADMQKEFANSGASSDEVDALSEELDG